MRILLVRHGETTYNQMGRVQGRLDTPLTPRGVEQARHRSSVLDEEFEGVYSSPLQRTHRTARIITGIRPTPLPGLTGIDMGTATGMRKEVLHTRLDQAAENGALWTPPHGEHPERFQERVAATLDAIAERHTGTVLVVTHAGVIRAYQRHLEAEKLQTAHHIPVNNGGVTVVEPGRGVLEDNVY